MLLSKEFSFVESQTNYIFSLQIFSTSCVMLGWLEDKKPEHNNGQICQMETVNIIRNVLVKLQRKTQHNRNKFL